MLKNKIKCVTLAIMLIKCYELQVINHLFKLHTINYNCIHSLLKPPNNVSMPQNILKNPVVN